MSRKAKYCVRLRVTISRLFIYLRDSFHIYYPYLFAVKRAYYIVKRISFVKNFDYTCSVIPSPPDVKATLMYIKYGILNQSKKFRLHYYMVTRFKSKHFICISAIGIFNVWIVGPVIGDSRTLVGKIDSGV